MKEILQKCIGSNNKSGITFVEVMLIGVLVPMVVKNIKNYVVSTDKHLEDKRTFTA